MTTDSEFDSLLHDALGEYREAEPLAGLEDRVLQRLHSQPVERSRAWRMWGAIAACAALVLLGIWLGVENPSATKEGGVGHPARLKPGLAPKESANPGHLPVSLPGSKELARVTKRPTPPEEGRVGRSAVEAGAMPVQFPMPAPLTADERAFIAALNQYANAMPAASDTDKAITIAEIEIKPLAIGGVSSLESSGEKQ